MSKARVAFAFIIVCTLVTAGCTENTKNNENDIEATSMEESQDEVSEANNDHITPEEESSDDLNVWIGGEVTVDDDEIIVEGESNIMPGATISANGISEGGMAVGAMQQQAKVEEDGSFHFQFPGRDDRTVIHLRLSTVGNSEAREYYGRNLENVTGPQVYLTQQEGQYEVRATIELDPEQETPYTIPIEIPEWEEIPEDYGEPEVWMEVDVTTDHQYIYFKGRSNLVEGARLGGNLKGASDNIVPFAFDHNHVQRDGTFETKIRYRTLSEGMYMPITFEPSPYSWDNVKEVYGERGEKLEGALVHTTEDGNKYVEYIVELDVPALTPPEEVAMTMEEEEIKLQVPDDLLFDFDESVLKTEAKETLDEIIDDLEKLEADATLHINGHTDNVGDPDYNMELSKQRAEAVFTYLEENGEISHLNIHTNGYGETEPIASNEDEEGRSMNRRVEIVINPQVE
ncbi:OmpA family protein [Aliibacillus thermotolerans]|uniref:OmpA family protein n=1 Tax=Aliibacillus thermotolerans TaxID=1834418 RepID=A0ABW0U4D0_9BACI|nr:OmpA family protein [Aliibacillus thermotolerans]MDA3129448.1 OmpA family protein [Aliibacillus thermotolerans]